MEKVKGLSKEEKLMDTDSWLPEGKGAGAKEKRVKGSNGDGGRLDFGW